MKTDQSQDKYNEIFSELREEKMNWDFDDFLEKTKEEEKNIQIISEKKNNNFQKYYWIAASLVLIASIGIFFKFFNKVDIKEQNNLVKNEIIKQKEDFTNGNEIVAVNTLKDTIKVVSDSLMTDSTIVNENEENDVLDKILPKRSRLKKHSRKQYVYQTPKNNREKSVDIAPKFESNYVIINGQKIENEEDAINLTKYSFRILSENISKTVAQTEAINNLTTD